MEILTGYSGFIITLGILGLVANIALVVTILRKHDQKSLFHITLISLSLSDILASFGATTYGLIYIISIHRKTLPQSTITNLSLFAFYFSNLASFFHIVLIAVQRFIATVFPLRYKEFLSGCRVTLILVLVWSISAGFLAAVALRKIPLIFIAYIAMGTCFTISIFYVIICCQMNRERERVSAASRSSINRRSGNVVLIHSCAVTAVFVISVIPSAIYATLEFRGGLIVFLIVTSFLVFNPLMDPLLYFFISHCRMIQSQRLRNAAPTGNQVAKTVSGSLTTRL